MPKKAATPQNKQTDGAYSLCGSRGLRYLRVGCSMIRAEVMTQLLRAVEYDTDHGSEIFEVRRAYGPLIKATRAIGEAFGFNPNESLDILTDTLMTQSDYESLSKKDSVPVKSNASNPERKYDPKNWVRVVPDKDGKISLGRIVRSYSCVKGLGEYVIDTIIRSVTKAVKKDQIDLEGLTEGGLGGRLIIADSEKIEEVKKRIYPLLSQLLDEAKRKAEVLEKRRGAELVSIGSILEKLFEGVEGLSYRDKKRIVHDANKLVLADKKREEYSAPWSRGYNRIYVGKEDRLIELVTTKYPQILKQKVRSPGKKEGRESLEVRAGKLLVAVSSNEREEVPGKKEGITLQQAAENFKIPISFFRRREREGAFGNGNTEGREVRYAKDKIEVEVERYNRGRAKIKEVASRENISALISLRDIMASIDDDKTFFAQEREMLGESKTVGGEIYFDTILAGKFIKAHNKLITAGRSPEDVDTADSLETSKGKDEDSEDENLDDKDSRE